MTLTNPTVSDILKYEFGSAEEFNQITPEIDGLLCARYGLSQGYFLRLQKAHDEMKSAREKVTTNIDLTYAYMLKAMNLIDPSKP